MESSLQKALKKAKRKQFFKIIIISIVIVLVALATLYRVGNYFAAKSTTRLHDALFLDNEIAQPNIQIDSQVTSSSTMFGGNIVTNRSKNIDGYVVQWGTLTSSYDWFRSHIDTNELVPGFYWHSKELYQYDKQTKQKVGTFYQPYTLKEIQKQIPDNLNIVWLYMASPIVDESKGPAGMPVYGFDPSGSPKEGYNEFIKNLKKYNADAEDETIQKFLASNKDKSFDKVKILGVMVTGQTQNFKALENKDFIRGASVGATAQMVPYIKPEK